MPRSPGRCWKPNCSGSSRSLHRSPRRQAGYGQAAHSGTLLLDDISELDPETQAKLLQFLQDGTFSRIGDQCQRQVSCRFICTASSSLEQCVEQGRFREDLLYRISGVSLRMPALAERREDLAGIAGYLLAEFTSILPGAFQT